MTIPDAFNDVTDALVMLREALHKEDIEEAEDAYDELVTALNGLKRAIGLPSEDDRPETS